MQLIYNDIDITKDVRILGASIKDNSGGIADSISILLSDTEKLWRQWGPQKNDTIILINNSFSSGLMYLDELNLLRGKYKIKGISTPLNSKTAKSRVWDNIRFKKLAQDLTEELGLSIEFYNVQDYTYDKLEQVKKSNLGYLNERCILEGYNLKISNGKAIIYDESTLENIVSGNLRESDFIGDYDFKSISSKLYSSCEIKYFTASNVLVEYTYTNNKAPLGPVLKIDTIRASNLGEAQRFSKNLLKFHNKEEIKGAFTTRINTNLAAASIVSLDSLGSFSGKYFIDSVNQDLTSDKSYFQVRKLLEGY